MDGVAIIPSTLVCMQQTGTVYRVHTSGNCERPFPVHRQIRIPVATRSLALIKVQCRVFTVQRVGEGGVVRPRWTKLISGFSLFLVGWNDRVKIRIALFEY